MVEDEKIEIQSVSNFNNNLVKNNPSRQENKLGNSWKEYKIILIIIY